MRQNTFGSYSLSFILMATLAMTACDGSDVPLFDPDYGTGQSPQENLRQGRFLDSAVANLNYRTESVSGSTDAQGRFYYNENESVTFAVGNIILGTTTGQPIVTPLQLVPGSDTGNIAVQNISRFLLALDQDGDPNNGITLSPAVISAAAGWPAPDFGSATFDSQAETTAIVAEAAALDGREGRLPSAATAIRHLEQTYYCAYGGVFHGNFSDPSGKSGKWGFLIDVGRGGITGFLEEGGNNRRLLLGQLKADTTGTITIDIHPQDNFVPWRGNLLSYRDFTANSGTVSGRRIDVSPGDSETTEISFRGGVVRGDLVATDTIHDIYSLVIAIDTEKNVTASAYSLSQDRQLDLQATFIDDDRLRFTLDGIELIAGGIQNGNYIAIAGSRGNEGLQGGACKIR